MTHYPPCGIVTKVFSPSVTRYVYPFIDYQGLHNWPGAFESSALRASKLDGHFGGKK